MSLSGKVSIVTGGGRGLGREYALALAAAGSSVLVCDLPDERDPGQQQTVAEQVAAEIVARGGRAAPCHGSVATWDGAQAIVQAALDQFGDLHIVVNNAGLSESATILETSEATWNAVLAVNLGGSAALTHWAARYWRDRGPQPGRAIVNISSPAGANPIAGIAAYCAAKAAVIALTLSSAEELAALGVRVNAVAPMARTRLTEGTPIEHLVAPPTDGSFDQHAPQYVAPLIVYLASPQCRLTGHLLGAEGDDIFVLQGWTAEHHFTNDEQPWSLEELHEVLGKYPQQTRYWELFPGPDARRRAVTPSDAALAALREVEAAARPAS
ncbi:MAG: SDR family NAD(P)-dependent oxidoreductase [Spongiibacteraceae bacterium]|nr:SDR family NAD(P)-dependent oxidoreductase [Spongiibacteraceae bacterium]